MRVGGRREEIRACPAEAGEEAPLVFTFLLQRTGNPISPAFYIVGAAIISTLAALTVAETARRPLPDT